MSLAGLLLLGSLHFDGELSEIEYSFLGGEFLVDMGPCGELVLDLVLVKGIQQHLEGLRSARRYSDSLAYNPSGVHDVVEEGFVDMGESTGTRPRLFAVDRGSLRDNSPLGDNHHGHSHLAL